MRLGLADDEAVTFFVVVFLFFFTFSFPVVLAEPLTGGSCYGDQTSQQQKNHNLK